MTAKTTWWFAMTGGKLCPMADGENVDEEKVDEKAPCNAQGLVDELFAFATKGSRELVAPVGLPRKGTEGEVNAQELADELFAFVTMGSGELRGRAGEDNGKEKEEEEEKEEDTGQGLADDAFEFVANGAGGHGRSMGLPAGRGGELAPDRKAQQVANHPAAGGGVSGVHLQLAGKRSRDSDSAAGTCLPPPHRHMSNRQIMPGTRPSATVKVGLIPLLNLDHRHPVPTLCKSPGVTHENSAHPRTTYARSEGQETH